MNRLLTLALTLAALLPSSALGQLTAGAKLRQESEQRARAEVTDLLRTLCPEQCVLLAVEAKVEEQTVGEVTPGFEAASAGARVPTLKSVSADVVLDAQLPQAFRTRLKGLVAQRLKGLGVPATVNVEAVSFPARNAPHLEAPQAPLAQRPPELPAPAPQPPPAPTSTPTQGVDGLSGVAPLLAVAVLLAVTVLLLGALLLLAVRKASAPPELTYAEPAPPPAPPEAAPAPPQFPAARLNRLMKSLVEERSLRNAVVREALARGEVARVASWTREAGEVLLEDLRGDASVAPAIAALSAELSRPPQLDASARVAALHDLEGRLIGARLSRASESVEEAFGFLEGVRPDRFVAGCRKLSPEALDVALRFAPAHLRAQVFAELDASRRAELALGWVKRPAVNAPFALAVADELRSRVAETTGSAQAERVLSELLDAMTMAEQDELLARMRGTDARAAQDLVVESTLLAAPAGLLGATLLSVPSSTLLGYLSGVEPAHREPLLAACPARLRAELEEELSMSAGGNRADFFAARRELLRKLKDEIARRGLTTAEVRTWNRGERPRLVSSGE